MPIEIVWMLAGVGMFGICTLAIQWLGSWSTHIAIKKADYAHQLSVENVQLRGYLMDIVQKFPEGMPVESEFEACPWCNEHYFVSDYRNNWEATPHAETCPFMGAVKFLNVPGYEEAPIG